MNLTHWIGESIFDGYNDIRYLIARAFYPIWMLICLSVFLIPLPRRKGFAWRAPLSLLLVYFASYCIPMYFFTDYIPINAIAVLVALSFGVYLTFDVNKKTAFFYSISSALLQNLSWHLDNFFLLLILDNQYNPLAGLFPFYQWDTGLCYLLALALTLIPTYFFICVPLKQKEAIEIQSFKLVIEVSFIFVVIYLLSQISQIQGTISLFTEIATSLCDASLLIALFAICRADRLAMEQGIKDSLLAKEQKHYEDLTANIEVMNRRAHDVKYQLLALEKGEIDTDSEKMKQLKDAVYLYERSPKTGNDALDNTIKEKQVLCEDKDITLELRIDGKRLAFMKPEDIYILFGNALDNAIECVALYPKKDRLIEVNTYSQGSLFKFHIQNPCFDIRKFRNGLPETSKEDHRIHGYGVQSMKEIVERYKGHITFENKADIFSVDILFLLSD